VKLALSHCPWIVPWLLIGIGKRRRFGCREFLFQVISGRESRGVYTRRPAANLPDSASTPASPMWLRRPGSGRRWSAATLRAPYVIEAMSCGAAFFDYDNDGWLDILVLTGSRFGDPPATASKRLYKNERGGIFTDVTEKAGLYRTGYEYGVANRRL
jgi:hypothetical protein